MTEEEHHSAEPCPRCGQPLHRWPTLDSGGFLLSCDECGFEQSSQSSARVRPPNTGGPRLKKLLDESAQPNEWPEELLEELPSETRDLLKSKTRKNPGAVPSDMEKRLRGYGYYLAEDGQGTRLTGEGPKPGTGDLSPLDVVRLAAELEGGLPGQGTRPHCPHCQAVLPAGADHCQWCGYHIPPDDTIPE